MEAQHSFARENAIDGIKALIAVLLGWASVVTAEQILTAFSILYVLFLLIEKLWGFYKFLKARRAAKLAPVNPKENG